MRTATIERNTKETQVKLSLNLDGSGKSNINTSCPFMDHMLTLFSAHGRFDLNIEAVGDIKVDYHHTVEDIGIALGKAFAQALGEMRGINRYGSITLPMDEALVLVAVDCSGRCLLRSNIDLPARRVGDFDTELVAEFWMAFVRNAQMTLHLRQLDGENTHHIIEAVIKGAGRALAQAVAVSAAYANEIPSTKGVL